MVRLVPGHIRLLPVRLPEVHEQGAALGELLPALVAEGPVVGLDPLVDDPEVLLQGALKHVFPALGAGHVALGLHVHVHDPDVSVELGPVVEPTLAELTVEPHQLLVHHLHVFC